VRILYLDCFSGLSGDMTLAALVDAGADRDAIERELRKLPIEPFQMEWKQVVKKGVSALKLDVLLDPNHPPVHHRHYIEIKKMIDAAGWNKRVTSISQSIFLQIGVAESKIHNIPLNSVHFHEVGAVDSIVDIVGIALAIDQLEVDEIWCAPVPLGSGMVRCDHGLYPIPAPATLEMMKGLPIRQVPYEMEMTTPTGAGIASGAVQHFSASLPDMTVESIGYGAGTRDLKEQPNIVRAVIGELNATAHSHRAEAYTYEPHLVQHDHVHENEHHHEHSDHHCEHIDHDHHQHPHDSDNK
jgi:uncharacterized protein (TIGR00299 family) protein